jgi:hypothetical protein
LIEHYLLIFTSKFCQTWEFGRLKQFEAELFSGNHKIDLESGILLKHGRYSVTVTLDADNDKIFGNMTCLATPKPQVFFDVLGSIGTSFSDAFKLPMKSSLVLSAGN